MTAPFCISTGCTNEATCVPRIVVPAQGWPIDSHEPLRLVLAVEVCDEHFDKLKIDDLAPAGLKRGVRDVVAILLRDKCPPDWERAFIEKVSLDSDEYRAGAR